MFNKLYDNSGLASVLSKAKTLSKDECQALYMYMDKQRPKNIIEFGTQFGCSTRAFIEISKWLKYNIDLHSWDIRDSIRKDCVDKKDFTFHLEDMTGRESEIFNTYKPDFVFLDAHAYTLTRTLMVECLRRKINFAAHDTYLPALDEVRKLTNNFKDHSKYVNWEVFLLGDLISKDLWRINDFENDFVIVKSTRMDGGYGMTIVEVKKGSNRDGD